MGSFSEIYLFKDPTVQFLPEIVHQIRIVREIDTEMLSEEPRYIQRHKIFLRGENDLWTNVHAICIYCSAIRDYSIFNVNFPEPIGQQILTVDFTTEEVKISKNFMLYQTLSKR